MHLLISISHSNPFEYLKFDCDFLQPHFHKPITHQYVLILLRKTSYKSYDWFVCMEMMWSEGKAWASIFFFLTIVRARAYTSILFSALFSFFVFVFRFCLFSFFVFVHVHWIVLVLVLPVQVRSYSYTEHQHRQSINQLHREHLSLCYSMYYVMLCAC